MACSQAPKLERGTCLRITLLKKVKRLICFLVFFFSFPSSRAEYQLPLLPAHCPRLAMFILVPSAGSWRCNTQEDLQHPLKIYKQLLTHDVVLERALCYQFWPHAMTPLPVAFELFVWHTPALANDCSATLKKLLLLYFWATSILLFF